MANSLSRWARLPLLVLLTSALVSSFSVAQASPEYDLVIHQGRVIDPESGLDAIRSVGISKGRIEAISEQTLQGGNVIDANGLVVSPGFIDLHSHAFLPHTLDRQMRDGVTTVLELESGAYPVSAFAPEIQGKARIHYGTSAAYTSARVEEQTGVRVTQLIMVKPEPISLKGYWYALMSVFGWQGNPMAEPLDAAAEQRVLEMTKSQLEAGAIGIGMPLDYFSEGIDREELAGAFELAHEYNAPIFVHVRRGINGDIAGLEEVIELAEQYKTSVHVCHIQHNAMKNTDLFLSKIREARERGVDVTTETLPYNAGSATISSAVFKRNWREVFAITYEDVQWSETGEFLSEETWQQYQQEQPDGQIIHHYVQEPWTNAAVVEPGVIIVSDLLPTMIPEQKAAPHIGAFSKILGRYVRDKKQLSLMAAIKKMTLLPAQRLEQSAPVFKNKGRIKVGADADITIFNPATITDNATYENPTAVSTGVEHVIVAGVQVLKQGELIAEAYPGEFLLAK